jgi:FkbM family methyltransferase
MKTSAGITAVRESWLGRWLVAAWHRLVPPLRVRRRCFGLTVYMDLRDNLYYWFLGPDLEKLEKPVFDVLALFKGRIWDVGANFGLFALRAASLGHEVVAFDLAPKSLRLLDASARVNGLNVRTVPRAFAVTQFRFASPKSASSENKVVAADTTDGELSITYLDAVGLYGIPDLIKMDIEGYEEVFLKSPEFHAWLLANRIAWIVELHRQDFWKLLPGALQQVKLDVGHVLLIPPGNPLLRLQGQGEKAKSK